MYILQTKHRICEDKKIEKYSQDLSRQFFYFLRQDMKIKNNIQHIISFPPINGYSPQNCAKNQENWVMFLKCIVLSNFWRSQVLKFLSRHPCYKHNVDLIFWSSFNEVFRLTFDEFGISMNKKHDPKTRGVSVWEYFEFFMLKSV